MCGIVGVYTPENAVPVLIQGLQKLEYRGYDSAGLAIMNLALGHATENTIERVRSTGRVAELTQLAAGMQANMGIAHTRWATHGAPSERNAHPHISQRDGLQVCLVHNGIIENHEALRSELKQLGYVFESDTDTEVIAHCVHQAMMKGASLLQAVQDTQKRLHGAYALAVLSNREPTTLVAARFGAPLLLGLGEKAFYVASDAQALVAYTQSLSYLEDGDVVQITPNAYQVYDAQGTPTNRKVVQSGLSASSVELGQYAHFMQKEIFEQPEAVAATLQVLNAAQTISPEWFGPQAPAILNNTEQVLILACGTSYHAGLVARYWIEAMVDLPVVVEIASEYRYRTSAMRPNTLVVGISQSGETADTLAALQHAKALGALAILGICNVPESALVRASDLVFLTRAGPEIGVASTKAFTTQLVALFVLSMTLAKLHQRMGAAQETEWLTALRHLPAAMNAVLKAEPEIVRLAAQFADKRHALFLGRGVHYPIALEGALKLKEITYIHAEGYAAGELKHGPLALVDAGMPVVAVAPQDTLIEKLKSNLEEVRARGGRLFIFADQHTPIAPSEGVEVLHLADHAGLLSPILHVLPLQLLSYHVALVKGTDVDKPRNLAKSVTVE